MVSFNRISKLPMAIGNCLSNGADHIIIVDNNSNDEVIDYLNSIKDSNNITVIFNDINVGASKGFMQAIESLNEVCDVKNSDVIFLDDDSYLSKDFKSRLYYDGANFISPRVVDERGHILKMNLPLVKSPSSFLDVLFYLLRRPVPDDITKNVNIVSASFVGLTMPADFACENKKSIPEDFFIYFDDVYFTLKLINDGYSGKYIPSLNIIHETTDYKRVNSVIVIYHLFRNAVVTHKYMTSWWWIIIFAKFIAYSVVILIRAEAKIEMLKYMCLGIVDGIKRIGR
ncbi:glycosyltransferase [Vibrio sp. dsl-7]|uniref:Glycosyltransferase n=2 Tax=Vibrio chanodichtyis TaxID=3027932 RepID=A0ABT5V1L5_9VIBR|nr:glycosyltransferase [Vibrio chanodichtyis]